MSNVKISVIVPIYNTEPYLKRCLDSIVNQTYSNLEIILINDGSTDNSAKIINDYAAADKRIIAIQKKNGGIGSAYNIALQNISGDYISFIDSDDYILLTTYEELVNIIMKDTPDLIHFGKEVFNDEGIVVPVTHFKTLDEIIVGNDIILDTHFKILKHPTLAQLFKKSLFENVIIFDQNIGIDEMLLPQLLMNCNKAAFVSKKYYFVYDRLQSVSRAVISEKNVKEILKVYSFICSFLEDKKPEFAQYLQMKYLEVLISLYKLSLINTGLLSDATLLKVNNELILHYNKLKGIYLYKKQSLKFKATTYLIASKSIIYNFLFLAIKKNGRNSE